MKFIDEIKEGNFVLTLFLAFHTGLPPLPLSLHLLLPHLLQSQPVS